MAFTEFCCRSGGNNMNGGGLNSNAEPATTPVYSATNGGWNSGTGVFTAASGSITGVNAGDWAHVFTDGSTTPTFIGRVVSFNTSGPATITVSTTVKQGTAPTTAGTGMSINVGGAWAGPSGASGFPITFMTGLTVNSSSARQRINMKNDVTYSVTAIMDIATGNGGGLTPITFQGYSSTIGDGGRTIIDGGTTGASYNVLQFNNNAVTACFTDFIFDHNGSTGTSSLVILNRGEGTFTRCTFRNGKGNGVSASFGNGYNFVNCDSYANGSNGFFSNVPGSSFYRCVASRNGANGFSISGVGFAAVECLAVANTTAGFNVDQSTGIFVGCNAYLNTTDGFFVGWRGSADMINCNSVSNAGWGIGIFGGATPKTGSILNCGFFSNTSGAIQTGSNNALVISGQINYSSTPFTDPANGDFRIGGAGGSAAAQTGYGVFQWVDTNYSARANNVSFPDVGMIQMQATGGSTNPVGELKQFNRGTPY